MHEERHGRAEAEAEQQGKAGKRSDLHRVNAEDKPPGAAQSLDDGNGLAAFLQIGGNRITDPDAADHQSGEPDQRQKQPQPFDETAHGGRGVRAVSNPPARHRKGFANGFDAGFHRRIVAALGQFQPIVIIDQRAGAQQTGGNQCLMGEHETRCQRKAAGIAVGFMGQDGAQFDTNIAHGQPRAGLNGEAVQQALFGHRAVNFALRRVARGQRIGKGRIA